MGGVYGRERPPCLSMLKSFFFFSAFHKSAGFSWRCTMRSCCESTSYASRGLKPACSTVVCTRNVHGELFRGNDFVREKCITTWMSYSTTYCSRHLKIWRSRYRWGRPHSSERFARGQPPLSCTTFSQSIALRDLNITRPLQGRKCFLTWGYHTHVMGAMDHTKYYVDEDYSTIATQWTITWPTVGKHRTQTIHTWYSEGTMPG